MTHPSDPKTSKWMEVTDIMDKAGVTLGRYLSYCFGKTPRRALYYTSYYKFASKMIGKDKKVLDVGCSEGLGTWILAIECGSAVGIDVDAAIVETASGNWKDNRVRFECADFLSMAPVSMDAVVSFDGINHILPEHACNFFHRLRENIAHDGIAIIGTPNEDAQRYASDVSKAGYMNVYSYERLEEEMERHFHHVFMFCANDELVHTGSPRMAQYLIAVGCRKK